ncbi:hypothetical protein BVY03_02025 [bacterium K02(2017)]|nr:hypothetical protein BVY03_02025 [bacterium K02(2017)]
MDHFKSKTIKLLQDGTWTDNGVEITHKRTLDLFNQSVYQKGNQFFLKGEKLPVLIDVEDTAFLVKALNKNKNGYELVLSDKSKEPLDLTTLDIGPENQLYCWVKNNSAKAKFERKVYMQFLKDLSLFEGYYGLKIDGLFYPIQSEDDAKNAAESYKKSIKTKSVKPSKSVKKQTVKKSASKKKTAKKKSSSKKKPAKKKKSTAKKSKKPTSKKKSKKTKVSPKKTKSKKKKRS